MSLRKKTVSALIWTYGQQIGGQMISFSITIILARILVPAEFGLIAMITIFISIGTLLVDSGLSSSLIRTKDSTQKDYSTVFYFNLAGSIVIYLIIYFIAPYIAKFYKHDILTSIIRIYSVTFILNALYVVQNAHLVKQMNFKTQAFIQIPAIIVSGVLAIFMAKSGYGVWSLVWMNIVQSLIITFFHWICSDWRPSLEFSKESFHTHFHFGYKMTLSGLLEIIYKNVYVLIIGKNYSATKLGYYSRADSLSMLPSENITTAMSKVTYPMFASISSDNVKLKEVYKKLMQQVIYWNTAILVLSYIIAEPLIRFILTEKWLPAVPFFKILCLANILYPLNAYNLNILKVKGRSDLILKIETVKKTINIIAIILVVPFGIYGLLYFQLLSSILSYYLNSFYSGRFIDYNVKEQLIDITPTIGLAFFVGFISYFLDAFLVNSFSVPDFGRLVTDTLFFFLLYLACSYVMQFNAVVDLKQLILKK
ncbi:polysaccharide biosynthesis protein [Pseudopedobacter saltans DSM 12145]|uniref:Polysaccharide biosynthesis protein n=1 Tax=Pseudopedobacter saltans (strain ATCC 51119 / DSM 12145 / JCM 21818 / CCUG 39354 / LMG 10337 / NBRC 100064 / NCIMB 13643) TaxID=762903 RepID=F0S9N0_PSESL|nr:lipopolysaccharide biosynthesis protein [Pseudopedobacter saltans]ADY51386.1 polysaccharide biosynthesis protein [Pseudopedobacter saltans DSM 12145]